MSWATLRREWGIGLIALIWMALLPLAVFRLYATDEVQYFSYVRSLYFDGDLSFANEYQHFADVGMANGDPAVYDALLRPNDYDPPLNPKTGNYRNVAPVGAAILWSPFFIAADGLVRLGILDGPADGYSKAYITAVCVASATYILLGLLLSYRLARRWAGVWASTIATITLWLASPLIFYTYIQMPWSHGVSFAMVTLFLTVWLGPNDSTPLHECAEQRSLRRWLALAVVGGLMVLTREQLGLFLLLPAIESLVAYWRLIGQHDWQAIRRLMARHMVFVATFAITLTPQLLAYQALYGQPKPSGTVSGKLNLISYHFFDTLLDPRRGAFLWAPILPIALLGLIWLWRRDRLLTLLLALGFIAQTYINGAFGTTWHLRGSFGFRRLIECTPIFIIGLAVLIERLNWPKLAVAALACALIAWNGGLIVQATVSNTQIRGDGLVWSTMVSDQLEAPRRAFQKLDQLLFNRCELIKNC